jgi:hypothetical protein
MLQSARQVGGDAAADLNGTQKGASFVQRQVRSTFAVRGRDRAARHALKSWATKIARRSGIEKAKVALARKFAVIMHRI